MKKLFKTTFFILTILFFFTTVSYALKSAGESESDFYAHLHWKAGNPEIANHFIFKFNPDGTFEIPNIGKEGSGNYGETTIFSLPNLEVSGLEADFTGAETTVKIWGFLFKSVLNLPKTDLPASIQIISGDGEVIIFKDDLENYFPFTFLGFSFSEEENLRFFKVTPDCGLQGEEDKDITIFCKDTKFTEQSPAAAFENGGIKINSTEVVNDTSLIVNIDIEEDASRGKGDIVINLSEGSTIIAKNVFEVKGHF